MYGAALAASFLLAGCGTVPYGGTYKFSGPGNFQEFARARYQCVQETAARQEHGYANRQYGNAAVNSTVMPNCSAFSACLAAKGYFRNPNGNLDASSIIVDCKN